MLYERPQIYAISCREVQYHFSVERDTVNFIFVEKYRFLKGEWLNVSCINLSRYKFIESHQSCVGYNLINNTLNLIKIFFILYGITFYRLSNAYLPF